MMLKKFVSLLCAGAFLLGSGAAVSADEAEKSEEGDTEITVAEGYDADKLTDNMEPALSFDVSGFDSYLHLTRDGSKAGLKFTQEKNTFYQGNSLCISASSKVDGFLAMSGVAVDANNNKLFSEAPEREESDKYSIVGLALYAKDFGLPSFDGCFISFAYRMTAEDKNALQGQSVYVYGADDSDVRVTDKYSTLTCDDVLNDNINKYNPMGTYSLPAEAGASRIIFDIPVSGSVNGAVLYLDNIMIQLPDSAGDLSYVKNVDGYNVKAEKRDGGDEIQVKKQKTDLGTSTDKVKTDKRLLTPAVIAVIAVAAVVVIAGIVYGIIRLRRRFY